MLSFLHNITRILIASSHSVTSFLEVSYLFWVYFFALCIWVPTFIFFVHNMKKLSFQRTCYLLPNKNRFFLECSFKFFILRQRNLDIASRKRSNWAVLCLLQDNIWTHCGAEPFFTPEDVRNFLPLCKKFEMDFDNIVYVHYFLIHNAKVCAML